VRARNAQVLSECVNTIGPFLRATQVSSIVVSTLSKPASHN
jgi:hypothetical protein